MKPKIQAELLDLAKELYFDGKFFREISVVTGISISALQKYSSTWLRNPGYVRNSHHKPKTQIKKEPRPKKQEAPLTDEHCMLTMCKRLIWILENDRCL